MTPRHHHVTRRAFRARPVAKMAGAGLTLIAAVMMTPAMAIAQGGAGSAAVVTPLLDMLEYGDTVGFPLACNDAVSSLSSVGSEAGASNSLAPFIGQIADQCASLSQQGNGHLQSAIAQSSALTLVNPVLNPAISALSSGLQSNGTSYGSSLAPFGPTIAGLGGTVAFFEGSGAGSGSPADSSGGQNSTSAPAPSGSGGNQNTYNMSAEADALQVVVTDPSLPAADLVNYSASPYGASATLNSLGGSTANAGAPYAPSIYSLPLTLNGLGSGLFPPLPPLPGYVSADYPVSPSQSQTQAGYQISANASTFDAKGLADIGVEQPGQSNAGMSASVETTANNDGSVTSTGSSSIDVLDFGSLIDIGKVGSTATMTEQSSRNPVWTSQTDLGTITLLGTTAGLLDEGATVLGQKTSVDLTSALIPALNTVLAPAGISLTYLPEQFGYSDGTTSTGSSPDPSKTVESVDSGALEVAVTQNVPSQGPTAVDFVLGRVYLSASDQPGFSYNLNPGSSPTVNTGQLGGLSGSTVTTPSLTTPSLATPSVTTNPAAASSTAPSSIRSALSSPTFFLNKGPSTKILYLVLILIALAIISGLQAFRLLAIRLVLSPSPTSQ